MWTPLRGLARTMKNIPRPLFLLHQTLQLAKCIRAGTVASVGLPEGEAWLIKPENAFLLIQSPKAASFTPLQTTLGHCAWWSCAWWSAQPWKPISWSSRWTVYVAPRCSLELGSECCNRVKTIFTCCVLQDLVVPFCELVWPITLRLSRCCY